MSLLNQVITRGQDSLAVESIVMNREKLALKSAHKECRAEERGEISSSLSSHAGPKSTSCMTSSLQDQCDTFKKTPELGK